jgi:hypothetical protein
MDLHSFSVRRRVLGRVLASSLGRITCLEVFGCCGVATRKLCKIIGYNSKHMTDK